MYGIIAIFNLCITFAARRQCGSINFYNGIFNKGRAL